MWTRGRNVMYIADSVISHWRHLGFKASQYTTATTDSLTANVKQNIKLHITGPL